VQITLTSKGQMTLPTAARARLGLKAGDRLLVTVVNDDTIVLKRLRSTSVKNLRGLLARPNGPVSMEEMDADVAEHLREKHRSGSSS
jgi:antitoxin PrlF